MRNTNFRRDLQICTTGSFVVFIFIILTSTSGFSALRLFFIFGVVLLLLYKLHLKGNFLLKERYLDKILEQRYSNFLVSFGMALGSFALAFFSSFCLLVLDEFLFANSSISWWFTSASWRICLKLSFVIAIAIYITYTLFLLRYKQQVLLHKQQVLTGNVSAQFESLKSQLDPHFLFNSLNVLYSLIEEDVDRAQSFTNALAKNYRYILDQKNKELVDLEEELNFAKNYLELMKMRFEEGLTYCFPDKIKQNNAQVIPLALQLLLENVIKHNKISRIQPIHIELREEGDVLSLRNTLNKKDIYDTRKGIGLENIADRYAMLCTMPLVVEETENHFTIKIPILTQKTKNMELLDSNQEFILIQAKKKVEKIKKFYSHLTIYLTVNLFFMVVNLLTDSSFLWFLIILFSWGIGILSHGIRVYDYHFFLGKNWEDRKIKEFMEKEKRN